MLDAFFAQIEAVHLVDASLRAALLRDVEEIEVPKKTLLLREGQRSDWAYMVERGLLRSYYLKDGEEVCSRFMPEGYMVIVVHSFYSRKPGYEFLETLEDSTLFRLHYDKLQAIYRDHAAFNFIGRALTQQYLVRMEERLFALRKMSAEERWQYFLDHYAHLIQRVPLKYIATFLGMNLETLSRVRGKSQK